MLKQSKEDASATRPDEARGAGLIPQLAIMALVDDIFGALEEKTLQRILDVFGRNLERATLVHIGRSPVQKPFFSRVLHLMQDPAVRRLPGRKSSRVNREAQGVF